MILCLFCKASGQLVNFTKSKITLSHADRDFHYNRVCTTLGVSQMGRDMLYLDVPLPFGRVKNPLFNYLVNRMHKKSVSWKDTILSKSGKMIMLKSVLQCLLTFVMSCLKITVGICHKLNTILKGFWWNTSVSDQSTRKVHWESWQLLCKNKLDGGLVVR